MRRSQMDFPEAVNFYSLPARNPGESRPCLNGVSWTQVLRRWRRRSAAPRARRLAYLDSTFPWTRSGFRYHEATALLELAPSTMFFSLWDMTDAFPAPIYPLADFPPISVQEGITDAYAVFQLFLAGLLGLNPSHPDPPHFMEGLDLSRLVRRTGMRLHGSIYPGGGLTSTAEGLAQAKTLADRLSTTFSYVPEVLVNLPNVTAVDQAFTETRFYACTDARWKDTRRVVCLFAADAPPRKGLDVALAAFARLPSDRFHLHVVGPHEHRRDELPPELATFHGWLSPEALRGLHGSAHVFVSPVSIEPPGVPGSFAGVTDGFPTQAAADAMSSGCLLVAANPSADHRVLTPGQHYLECRPEPDRLRATLEDIARDPLRMRFVADVGSRQVRERMDVRRGVGAKLRYMGFGAEGEVSA
jgi:glycosyltransferase involved in cell wall biosynthesis